MSGGRGTSFAAGLPSAVEMLLLCAWAGGAWFAGFVAAPQLFDLMPPAQAGTVAGRFFSAVFWLSLPALVFSLWRIRREPFSRARRVDTGLVMLALAISLLNEWALHPWINALREDDVLRATWFGVAHGASTVLYLVNGLLAAAIVLRRR